MIALKDPRGKEIYIFNHRHHLEQMEDSPLCPDSHHQLPSPTEDIPTIPSHHHPTVWVLTSPSKPETRS